MNNFIYKKTRSECVAKSDNWCMQAVNEILEHLKINANKRTLSTKMIENTETILGALKDELKERGITYT